MSQVRRYFRARPERNRSYRATVAIDWGSEAVRMKLLLDTGDGEPLDKLLQHTSTVQGAQVDRQEFKRQFTSQIYPFDNTSPNPPGETIYPGNERLLGRRSISSKLGMYVLVGVSDEVARQSPQLRVLQSLVLQNPQIKQNIRIGIEQILLHVLDRLSKFIKYCLEPLGRGLDAIALTIPAQWTIEFEEEYGELLTGAWNQTFGVAAPQIIFLNEGQTNVHYAFYRGTITAWTDREHLDGRQFFDIGKSKNAVLVIDAGGHSTNTSLVTICEDDNQLEIRPDHGAIGGTALWAWHVLQLAQEWLEDWPMTAEVENQVLKTFYMACAEYRVDTGASFEINLPWGKDFFILSPEKLVQTFDAAYRHAFALIEEGLLQLKDLQPICERIKVVVGGGSAQGAMWMRRMTALCTKHQMDEPIFLWQICQIYEYARLAGGANYALANAKSVAQFVDRAAFGLAVKKRFRGRGGWTTDWHYQSTLLWARGNKWIKTITTDGSEDFKIICQPEYDNPRPKSIIEPNYKAYDLLPIPCHKKGTLQFDFEIDTETDTLKLVINHRKVLKSGKTVRSNELGRVEFDLWVPPGSRCLQIWDCEEDIEAKVAAAFAVDSDDASETEVDSGAAHQPRARLRRSARTRSNQQGAQAVADPDVELGEAEPGADQAGGRGGSLPSAAARLQAPAGAPQASVEDVEMGGMDDDEEIADSITVAQTPDQASQSSHGQGGSQAARRHRRRGSIVPSGIFAV